MRRRSITAAVIAAFFILLVFWQLPSLLRLIPSRYVAAYVPEPIQDLAQRDQIAVLPTSGAPVDASGLLGKQPTVTPVNTPLPPPVIAGTTAGAVPLPSPTATPTAIPTATPLPFPTAFRLDGFEHQFQGWNNCGPATIAMALSHFGIHRLQYETAAVLKPSTEDRNVSPDEMAAYVVNDTDIEALFRVNGDLDTLRRLIANGMPVIIELGIDPPGEYAWLEWYGHYMLVVAYDDTQAQIWTYDSWLGTSAVPGENATPEGRVVSYADLEPYWQQFNRNYIVLYRPEQRAVLEQIVGRNLDDGLMWEASLRRAQTELSEEPGNAFLWFNLGTTLNALGDYKGAATAFDRAREIGLPWRMLWYQFGPYEAYYNTGRYEEVILLADATMGDRPYFEEAFYYKGLAQLKLNLVEEGRRNIERAVEFNPNFKPASRALAELNGA